MFKAEGLYKSFGALEVAKGISLELPRGARHAIVGPNGSGKTTLFNLLSGELQPDAGHVFIDGRDVTSLPPDARARAGLTRSFQKNNLFPDLTVLESLAVAVAIGIGGGTIFWRPFARSTESHRRAAEIAERIRLTPYLDAVAGTLPYGTQRQLEIGLALAIEPKILLLDEPTAGMSADETAEMAKLIGDLPDELALLVIEHDMEIVFDFARRITVLDYGSVLAEGTPAEIRASQEVRRRYLGEAAR
ncbi:MAG TPA: ABC transporter ATP-binding protein [Stellaceae bacterium]|jgi:ABC-type branched-subunit amino acid transport system ATPase component|nr:ABC transporter ATP-binding protein [Stellaceae bacterium]